MKNKIKKSSMLLLILITLSIIGTALIYNKLPDIIPTHWNVNGQIDSYNKKYFAWITGLLPLFTYISMKIIPKIDPKKQSFKKHEKAYNVLIILLILFFICIHWTSILTSLNYNVNISMIISICVGVLFLVIGNYMPQIRPNYSFGIKTPWTLDNEIVWKKTHRLGGNLFILIGILFILTSFIANSMTFNICTISIILATIYIYIYSYIQFRKIQSK
ncbi:immunity protein SdpI [Clostridium acetireducens DSM 10703]|jgi:uncharacterized membrane protein|uniref:Immunity protein SdpI n=1 Tax=Clostridium acetireducens DSM 10703 TaxID=1121290 RepID=A0A1E8EX03_9CLOT|nr:SdpI family protein [Clostridium acetireducens]OFI05303.1 immunity protein SdpI [Clostridium acetireducens DSM 10703]